MKTLTGWQCLVLSAGLLAGCNNVDEQLSTPEQQDLEIQEYLETIDPALNAAKADTGYYYIPLRDSVGGRTQISGTILSVYYSIETLDGTPVASHQAQDGEPIKLKRGAGTIYPIGLDDTSEGLAMMREGELYRFIFPSHLAYGEIAVNETLPPHSIVVMEVELVRIENEGEVFADEYDELTDYLADRELTDPDTIIRLTSGLRMVMTREDSLAQPVESGDEVGINFRGLFTDGTEFQNYSGENIFEFTTGEQRVIAGLEEGILSLRLGERAILLMPSELAYGPSVTVIPSSLTGQLVDREIIPSYAMDIPPFTPLIFEVEIRSIQ